jgi:hypothetical protein
MQTNGRRDGGYHRWQLVSSTGWNFAAYAGSNADSNCAGTVGRGEG